MDSIYHGRVAKGPFAGGSKSEHNAAFLVMAGGDSLRLRRRGGNAFQDDVLDALVGKEVVCEGVLHSTSLLIVSKIEAVKVD